MKKEKRTTRNEILSSNYRNDVSCPICGSTKVGLWNTRKKTYHCHECDSYFNRYSRLVYDSEPVIRCRNTSFGWNGFIDPDDFPSDGFGDGGW